MDIFFYFVLLGMTVATLLYIWFDTSAFTEYITLFRLDKLFLVYQYKIATKDDPNTSYPSYLASNYNNFFTRLISCPKCLSIWLSILVNLIFVPISIFYPLGVLITAYLGLLLYYILVRLS